MDYRWAGKPWLFSYSLIPARIIDKLISYVLQVRQFSKMFNYQSSCIIAMDETPYGTTWSQTQQLTMLVLNLYLWKPLVTRKLWCRYAWRPKLMELNLNRCPMIVFRGVQRETKALGEEFKNRCVVASSTNAWTNEWMNEWTHVTVGTTRLASLFIPRTFISVGFVQVSHDD